MGASPQSLKPLLHQAIRMVEEFHANRTENPQPDRMRFLHLDQEQSPPPNWLKPNANRDLAVRAAFSLARKTRTKGGYLAVGEPALHAVMRMWLLVAGVKAGKVLRGDIEEKDFPRLTAAAGQIAGTGLLFSNQDVPRKKIAQTTRKFIEESQLEFLVVDDPDVETLSDPRLLPELERWRIRMEFREAVRGTKVMMILPG